MSAEEILRGALAFILCQQSMDHGARITAFNALKRAYGDQIAGSTIEEHDRINNEQFERNLAAVTARFKEQL